MPDVYKRQDVIRRIFREALEGSNTSQIARSLNDEGIPTPGQYFKSKHSDKMCIRDSTISSCVKSGLKKF